MTTDDPERISEIVSEMNAAYKSGAPPEEIFKFVERFYAANKYRREVQDIAILTLMGEVQALKASRTA